MRRITDAHQVGADFVTLSPVPAYPKPPSAAHLGWSVLRVIAQAAMPVYLLGGMTADHLEKSPAIGAPRHRRISGYGLGRG